VGSLLCLATRRAWIHLGGGRTLSQLQARPYELSGPRGGSYRPILIPPSPRAKFPGEKGEIADFARGGSARQALANDLLTDATNGMDLAIPDGMTAGSNPVISRLFRTRRHGVSSSA
jgi:hypothetical protein